MPTYVKPQRSSGHHHFSLHFGFGPIADQRSRPLHAMEKNLPEETTIRCFCIEPQDRLPQLQVQSRSVRRTLEGRDGEFRALFIYGSTLAASPAQCGPCFADHAKRPSPAWSCARSSGVKCLG